MRNLTHKNHIMMFADSSAPLEKINGTQYRKMIAKYGKWVNPLFPIEYMELDKEWAQEVAKNFEAKVIDHVPIPLNHTDDVSANTGELVGVEVGEDGLYGILEIRDWQTIDKIESGVIFDVSISFDWNYVDTELGQEHGPVLLHVALVNNPYLKGMTGFEKTADQLEKEEAEAAAWGDLEFLTDFSKKHKQSAIMLSESKAKELREMLVTIKNDRDFPVTISVKDEDGEAVEKVLQPGEECQVPQDQSEAILATITDAVKADEDEEESEEEKAAREAKEAEDQAAADKKKEEDEAAAAAAAADADKDLTDEEKAAKAEKAELADLRKKNAALELSEKYQTLLKAGKITPAQKDRFMALAEVHGSTVQLSGKPVQLSQVVVDILSAGPQVVKFDESGTAKTEEEKKAEQEAADAAAAADASKKPSELLSDQEKAGMQAVGADPSRMDELAGKYPAMAAALNQTKPTNEEK
jgi:hypothetical protein